MDDFELLIDLHSNNERQGPGSESATQMAIELAGLDRSTSLEIADMGCGTGASSLSLARCLNAHITALDLSVEFIDVLRKRAAKEGLSAKISPIVGSMENPGFAQQAYDVIWSEGAIYNIGFERGVREWMPLLKPSGMLVVSDITWLSNARPPDLEDYWLKEYAEIDSASSRIRILEKCGFTPVAYFVLPEYCWLDAYYHPLIESFPEFLSRHGNNDKAQALVDAELREIAMYKTFKRHYGYGVYIARKL